MGKLYGVIGFVSREDVEVEPGIYESLCSERPYKMDEIEIRQSYVDQGASASSIRINTKLSVLADTYAFTNLRYMKYVEYMGSKYLIESVTPHRPRLIITLGDLYHEG